MKKEDSDLGIVKRIPCDQIRPFEGQPRNYFDPEKMKRLAASIDRWGQKVPGKVWILSGEKDNIYKLIDGERRLRACQSLGIPFLARVVDRSDYEEKDQFLDAVILNWGSEPHTEWENFEAICRVREDHKLTLEETADCFGRSVGWVQQYLSLEKLQPSVFKMLDPSLPKDKQLTFSHAVFLASLEPDLQVEMARASTKEGLKLREVKYLVEQRIGTKRSVDWSPRRDREKFENFLKRTRIDLKLLLEQPQSEFEVMFRTRSDEDLRKMSGMMEKIIGDFSAIKESLERVGKSSLRRVS